MAEIDRVIVCVFDGLRPDMVRPDLTPNLIRFAQRATWFRDARSVFPSMTRVATASIATGAMPSTHGIVGNAFYFPQAIPEHVLDVSIIADIKRAEAASAGRFLMAETFADILARAGHRVAIVHTGSLGSTYLINPRAKANKHWTYTILGGEGSETPDAIDDVMSRFGSPPERGLPRFAEIDYATKIMVEHVLPESRNAVSLIWYNEPDTSYHYKLLGAPETLAVLSHVDAAFGQILDWVERQPNRDRIAVLVASDHGQVSSHALIALPELLGEAGHPTKRPAARELNGAAVTFTGGNMGEIRILDGGAKRRDAIAAFLLEQPYIGALFSPGKNEVEGEVEGSFSHSLVGLNHERAPELLYVMRSSDALDPFGLPGLCALSGGGVPQGGGMHGGLNRHELNTTLIMSAPGHRHGVVERGAAGIIDIAPTLLDLFGLPKGEQMDGVSLLQPLPPTHLQHYETGAGSFRHNLSVARGPGRLILGQGYRQD